MGYFKEKKYFTLQSLVKAFSKLLIWRLFLSKGVGNYARQEKKHRIKFKGIKNRQIDKETDGKRYRWTYGHMDRWKDRQVVSVGPITTEMFQQNYFLQRNIFVSYFLDLFLSEILLLSFFLFCFFVLGVSNILFMKNILSVSKT